MYLKFFGLQTKPFNPTPDQEFLYLSPSHKQALGSILYGVKEKKGFISVTGQVGLGKTTILRSFLAQVDQVHLHTIYLLNPNLSFTRVLKTLLRELGHDSVEGDDAEMVEQLHMVLIKEYQQSRTVVLLIDEAQNMPMETLEHLRVLSNLETPKDKLIQIVLLGQPELDLLLDRYELRQLRQRIAVRATLLPLSNQESLQYIQHRLDIAGGKGKSIFTKSALSLLVEEAKGAPRQLNILCDNALVTALGYEKKLVTASMAKEVIRDLTGQAPSAPWRFMPFAIGASVIVLIVLMPLAYFYSDSVSLGEIRQIFHSEERPQQAIVDPKNKANSSDQKQLLFVAKMKGWMNESVPEAWNETWEGVLAAINSATIHSNSDVDVALKNQEELSQHKDSSDDLNDWAPTVEDESGEQTVPKVVESTDPSNRATASHLSSLSEESITKQVPVSPLVQVSLVQVEPDLEAEEVNDSMAEKTDPQLVTNDLVTTTGRVTEDNQSVPMEEAIPVATRDKPHRPLPPSINQKPKAARSKFPVTKILKKGQTIAGLMQEVYGSSGPSILRFVLDNNRHIVNVRKIYPGQKIVFPRFRKKDVSESNVAAIREPAKTNKKRLSSSKKIYTRSSTRTKKLAKRNGVKRSPPYAMAIVKEGDTLEKLAKVVYGSSSPQYIQRVLDYNPQILNPKRIIPGQDIAFPRMVDEGRE